MAIYQAGAVNTAAQQVPGVIVQIIPPAASPVNGVPTDILGVVGSATWGPVNKATIVGNYAQYRQNFGDLQNRTFDMGTHVATAILQGAQNFRCVRVTDGTDTAASNYFNRVANAVLSVSASGGSGMTPGTYSLTFTGGGGSGAAGTITVAAGGTPQTPVVTNCGTGYTSAPTVGIGGSPGGTLPTLTATVGAATSQLFTAKYTGTLGSTITATLSAGQAANTWNLTIAKPNSIPEVFAGLTGTGAAFWQAMANAVNNGQSLTRGPSKLVTALYQSNPAAIAAATVTLTGGTDGASGLTYSNLLGADGVGSSRTGMYALRGTGCAVGLCADVTQSAAWPTIDAFALSEGIYFVHSSPAGDTIGNFQTAAQSAGLSYASKLMFGDFVWWNDPVNQIARLVSPQGFTAGALANTAPQLGLLNKQAAGVVGTQASLANSAYSNADLLAIVQAGGDVIANPGPGGQGGFYWWTGQNASYNVAINGDNYTRLTFFIARSLNIWAGQWIGQLQTAAQRQAAWSSLDQWLLSLWQQGIIGSADSAYPNGAIPFAIVLDDSNNPPNRVALGWEQADIQITYLSVIRNFLANIQAGQTVQITPAPTTPAGGATPTTS
jgi:hypothetical protein